MASVRSHQAFSRLRPAVRVSIHPLAVPTRSSQYTRSFSSTRQAFDQQKKNGESWGSRLRRTKIEWKPIPVALGVGFLGVYQFYRIQRREAHTQRELEEEEKRPQRRERIRPSGPWQVRMMSYLPLKALSRLWGKFNELTIPYYLRVPGFKLYSFIFGVNLSEVAEPDLHVYPNLAAFFYRELKPNARPIDPNPNAIVSPADGKIIQFGVIENGEVEQVKGVTYSLDALLGSVRPSKSAVSESESPSPSSSRTRIGDEEHIQADEEFANLNGISYTLPNLFSGGWPKDNQPSEMPTDQSLPAHPSAEAEVRADLALSESSQRPWWSPTTTKTPTTLYYCVIYLAPGDYHRFHSPASWVVESRRHFAGELYSVSPYLQRTLPGLFTLNERVVLLGRWRWGFFSYTPVGATNVGSIKINFDRELRTNSLLTDTAADRAAEQAKARGEAYSGFAEASYENSSSVLGGHALKRGDEMGGFQLGSTIVLVFEAPVGKTGVAGDVEEERKGGWKWLVGKNQKVRVGEALGVVEDVE